MSRVLNSGLSEKMAIKKILQHSRTQLSVFFAQSPWLNRSLNKDVTNSRDKSRNLDNGNPPISFLKSESVKNSHFSLRSSLLLFSGRVTRFLDQNLSLKIANLSHKMPNILPTRDLLKILLKVILVLPTPKK